MKRFNTQKTLRIDTTKLVKDYIANGGIITVCPNRKRKSNSFSWTATHMRASISNRGRKANTLRSHGLSKAN